MQTKPDEDCRIPAENVKHSSRPLLQNTTVDCSYISREKFRHLWPSENVETQKLSHTEGRKITPALTKCLDLADTLQNTQAFTASPHPFLGATPHATEARVVLASAVFFLVQFVVGDMEWFGFFWLLGGERGVWR